MTKIVCGLLLMIGSLAMLYLSTVFAAEPAAKGNPPAEVAAKSPQIEIKCQITKTDGTGKSQVLACPRVVCHSGKTAIISLTQPNGEALEIQLTGHVLPAAKGDDVPASPATAK